MTETFAKHNLYVQKRLGSADTDIRVYNKLGKQISSILIFDEVQIAIGRYDHEEEAPIVQVDIRNGVTTHKWIGVFADSSIYIYPHKMELKRVKIK